MESGTTGITTQMTSRPDMTAFQVSIASKVNGAVTAYTILAVSPLPHVTGDILKFTVPAEITLPSTASCTAQGSTLTSVVCAFTSTTYVTVTLTFTGGTLNAGTSFQFLLNGVTNPPDTRQSSTFTSILMTDSTAL